MKLERDTLETNGTPMVRREPSEGRYFITFRSEDEEIGSVTLGYFVSAPPVIEKVFEQ